MTSKNSNNSSFTSVTPPSLPENAENNSDSSISENIASSNGSVENDRSFQEIIITNVIEDDEPQQQQQQCDKSDCASVISLNALEKFQNVNIEVQKNVQSILDEILQNEQFRSGSNSNTMSLNSNHMPSETSDVFKNVSEFLSDVASLNGADRSLRKMREFEDLLVEKDDAIAALAAENDSLKELVSSNPSSVTEYRPYCDDRYVEFQTAIAHRDDLIQQLTVSLQQSLNNREQLQRKSDGQIGALRERLKEYEERVDGTFRGERSEGDVGDSTIVDLEVECYKLEETLNVSQVVLMNDLKCQINLYVQQKVDKCKGWCRQEIRMLNNRIETERTEHDGEVTRLRELLASVKCGSSEIMDLRQELESSHARQMEELRTYFEKKCTDMEKNYSEEIFSQQSRKMSGSSSGSEICSDALFSPTHQPGPCGDGPPQMISLDEISPGGSKKDMNVIRNELQNKYHAELEILREDYENRTDELNIKHENKLETLEHKFAAEIETLQRLLEESRKNSGMVEQEVANSGDFELAEVVQSYERRLQEQVMLAKLDIISALEHQIQMLVESSAADYEWPTELLQLREKLAGHYKIEMGEMEAKHLQEVAKIKEEHDKNIHRVHDRERRRSLRDGEGDNAKEILQERDNLKKSTVNLRHLVGELMKYFTKCEDELNNTLVDELLKYGFDKDLTQVEAELAANLDESGIMALCDTDQPDESSTQSKRVKRVHFTPNVSNFMNLLDNSITNKTDNDISVDFRSELDTCLKRLKAEANAILVMTTTCAKSRLSESESEDASRSSTNKVTSLSRKLITETQEKNDLIGKLDEANRLIQTLENERLVVETEMEGMIGNQQILEVDLQKAHQKICELIEHKEIVSEGFGESNLGLGTKISTMTELQEKARTLIAESAGMVDNPLLPLVEELCREADRLTEEAKKDRSDLLLQIEAADKKLRATCHFLEDQAAEREMERDEAQKEIASLQEEIRDRDKDRSSCERISQEVEHLEQQIRDLTAQLTDAGVKKQDIEQELKEAVDKVWVLRDIIRDLEAQVASKSESEHELQAFITELQGVISHQTKNNDELSQELDSIKSSSDGQFNDHIVHLEDEIQKLRLNTELAGSEGTLKQLKSQLQEIEITLDKRTKELETLHTVPSATTCSSPSEDMSIRDQIQPPLLLSPSHHLHPDTASDSDLSLPLQQLARLKDKLVRHSRAEDAAVKRIRDLEMQVTGIARDFEEVQNERDSLQEQLQEQLVLIASLQVRLDEQRLRAENVQNVQNTSLEAVIYDLQNEVQSCRETLHLREKSMKQLNKTIDLQAKQIDEQKQRLMQTTDSSVVDEMNAEMETLKSEIVILQSKIANPPLQPLPGFVESILAEKNTEIEHLKSRFDTTNAELQKYLSLNLNDEQIRNLSSIKRSDLALSDIISLTAMDEPDQMRHDSRYNMESLHSLPILHQFYSKNGNETPSHIREISSIEKVGPSCVNFTMDDGVVKRNSTEIPKSTEKHVRFDANVDELKQEIERLKEELNEKNANLKEYLERMNILTELEVNVTKLQEKLESTEESLIEVTKKFEKEMNELKEIEKNLRIELAEKKMNLMAKENDFDMLEKDSVRKDQMYINLAKEKRDLEKKINDNDVDNVLSEKNEEILQLEQQLADIGENAEKLEDMENLLLESERNLRISKENVAALEAKLLQKDDCIDKLTKEVANQNVACDMLKAQIGELLDQQQSQSLNNSEVEIQIAKNKRQIAERDLMVTQTKAELDNVRKELKNVTELIIEKDKVIHQMSDDSKTLHTNLETIQSKMQETGNVIDLSKKLRDEQQKTADLQDELKVMKKSIDQRSREVSLEEVTTQMKRQLEYSAHLDTNIFNAINSDPNLDDEEDNVDNVAALRQRLEAEKRLKDGALKDLAQKEHEYEMEKENVNRLQYLLEREKETSNGLQIQDANLIETLRIRLETAMDNEMDMEKMLDHEKMQVAMLKHALESVSPGNSKSTETTDYKSLPIMKERAGGVQTTTDQMELDALKNDNVKLKAAVKSLKRTLSESEANLKHINEVLSSKIVEIDGLVRKVDEFHETNSLLREKHMRSTLELDQKERELVVVRQRLHEVESERKELKKQITDLNQNLKQSKDIENNLTSLLMETRDNQLKQPVPEKFLHKIKELSSLVQDNMKDNRQMTNTLGKLTDERTQLQQRIRELESQLYPKLPFDDPVARANHLFGRYMRTESYRKALVWQKRYLLALLATYQEASSACLTDGLRTTQSGTKRSKGAARFRSVGFAIVSVYRMQFLVKRWHSGKRSAPIASDARPAKSSSSLNLMSRFNTLAQTHHHHRYRNVVPQQQTEEQSDSNSRPTTPNVRLADVNPWSGVTPPSRDPSCRVSPGTSTATANIRIDDGNRRLSPPSSQAPAMIAEYIERFDQIQRRLGMATFEPPT